MFHINCSKMTKALCLSVALGVFTFVPKTQAQDFKDVEIKVENLGHGIYALFGMGGNIGASVGDDGIILVDDQFAPLTDKILAALSKLSDKNVIFILNTHYHGDHTGGNENHGSRGTIIVANDAVYDRLSMATVDPVSGEVKPASPKDALPKVTFNDKITFHFNGETSHAVFMPHAHTDGDSVIFFNNANVVHMGDTLFNYLYPYIDVDAGGSVDGVLAAQAKVLAMVDDSTQIIPGHGPMAKALDLRNNHAMIKDVRGQVYKMKKKGMTLEQVLAAAPSKAYDEKYNWAFINAEKFVTSIYVSLPN